MAIVVTPEISMQGKSAYQILDLQPGASLAEIRASYKNLAQVWHPDRFTGNPKLQQLAQEKMREINGAYEMLEHQSRAMPTPESTNSSRPPEEAQPPQASWHPQSARVYVRRREELRISTGSLPRFLILALGIVGCLWLVNEIGRSYLTPLAAIPLPGRISSPAPLLDPMDDLHSAARLLNDWAQYHMEKGGIPIAGNGSMVEPDLGRRNNVGVDSPAVNETARAMSHHPKNPIVRGRSAGAGKFSITNTTPLDAIAELVPQSGRKALSLQVFVPAGGSVSRSGVPVGVYDLVVRSGSVYEFGRFKTLASTRLIAHLQFLEVRGEEGVSGDNYSIILKPE